jgi:hypothetical protein
MSGLSKAAPESRDRRTPKRFNPSTISILFAFVFFRCYDTIVYSIRMEHHGDEVKEKEADAEAGRGDRGQKYENSHGNCSGHPQKTCESMSFVNMSQTRNDAQDNCYCVTRFAFCSFRRAALPIASVTALRVLWQEMSAVRTGHFIHRG